MAALVVAGRLSVELAPVQWWRGQEAAPGDWRHAWAWAACVLPMGALLLLARTRTCGVCVCRVFSCRVCAGTVATVQWACTLAHWGTQALGVAVPWPLAHALPRAVYGLAVAGTLCRFWFPERSAKGASADGDGDEAEVTDEEAEVGEDEHGEAEDRDAGLWLWLWPYLLLVGPASPAAASLFCAQVWGARSMGASELSTGVVLSLVATQAFFATGHESSFNKLHYASPFVGFDEYEYFRGAAMLGLNTFGTYVAAAALATGARQRRALLLALSAKAATMVAFVALERRHLMVWAIFAPKYVFDGVALLVANAALLLFRVAAQPQRQRYYP